MCVCACVTEEEMRRQKQGVNVFGSDNKAEQDKHGMTRKQIFSSRKKKKKKNEKEPENNLDPRQFVLQVVSWCSSVMLNV